MTISKYRKLTDIENKEYLLMSDVFSGFRYLLVCAEGCGKVPVE